MLPAIILIEQLVAFRGTERGTFRDQVSNDELPARPGSAQGWLP
jgi:hypothetical protein